MFIENLINDPTTGALGSLAKFTDKRSVLLAKDLVNFDTPNYINEDLSLKKFQSMLSDRIESSRGRHDRAVSFDDIQATITKPQSGILMHDGNNRSIEQIVTDQAKNALMHNTVIELLRKQFSMLEMALREKVS